MCRRSLDRPTTGVRHRAHEPVTQVAEDGLDPRLAVDGEPPGGRACDENRGRAERKADQHVGAVRGSRRREGPARGRRRPRRRRAARRSRPASGRAGARRGSRRRPRRRRVRPRPLASSARRTPFTTREARCILPDPAKVVPRQIRIELLGRAGGPTGSRKSLRRSRYRGPSAGRRLSRRSRGSRSRPRCEAVRRSHPDRARCRAATRARRPSRRSPAADRGPSRTRTSGSRASRRRCAVAASPSGWTCHWNAQGEIPIGNPIWSPSSSTSTGRASRSAGGPAARSSSGRTQPRSQRASIRRPRHPRRSRTRRPAAPVAPPPPTRRA